MAAQNFRYSTANVATSASAQSFPWENPVPINSFWDSISYGLSRNFLDNFTDEEVKQLPIDQDSTASTDDKLRLLLRILQETLEKDEAAVAPKLLNEVDFPRWDRLTIGVYAMQSELGLPEAEATVRSMVDKQPDNSFPGALYSLADYLLKTKKYAEAEEVEKQVCTWMDAKEGLGKDSPQALAARRVIIEALYKQGPSKRAEADFLISETRGIIEGMGNGRFGVYQQEETDLLEELLEKL